jgi:acetylornithine deacetylase/succinyl-diaminopimelate desuccinylase-like protein
LSTDEILDQILIPRPNGSEALERVASFLASALESHGAAVGFQRFDATPHGFQLAWSAALLLMLGWLVAAVSRRYGLALLLTLVTPVLLLLEFEALWSPVSGLWPLEQRNVVGSFDGAPFGPLLIFAAHYDTTTHFGDHFTWRFWGFLQGPATALALALPLAGLWRRRRGKELPRALLLPLAALVPIPFAAMFWCHTVGPLVRTPSPGAVDNGGSVAALLRLSERLGSRPAEAPTTVRLVFLAAEEERALGSWAYAQSLERDRPLAVFNLESLGAGDEIAYVPEDGFALRRYRSPDRLVALANAAARELWGAELPARALPSGTLTDGRSFLAQGIPALTLRAFTDGAFPRKLHSRHDSRDRLSVPALERSAELLEAIVLRVDADPSLLERSAGAARR